MSRQTNQKKKTGCVILSIVLVVVLFFVGVKISQKPELIEQTKASIASILGNGSVETRATKDQYDKLEIGMTMDDVKECLGRDVLLTRSEVDTYMFVIEYEDGKEDTATIVFNGDKLLQKSLFSEQRSFKN